MKILKIKVKRLLVELSVENVLLTAIFNHEFKNNRPGSRHFENEK